MNDIIVLRSVYGKVLKYFISPMRDPSTGRYPDCVRPVNANGDMILSEKDLNSGKHFIPENHIFELMDGTTFDLTDPYKLAEWEAIRHCPIIALALDQKDAKGNYIIHGNVRDHSHDARYGEAELYIERPGADVVKKVSKRKLIHNAEAYIYGDEQGADGRLKMVRILGKDMSRQADADVTNFLLEIAEKDPQRIINLYTGGDLGIRLLFIEARDKNVIVFKDRLYMYQNNVLGASEEATIEWMKDTRNAKILKLLKRDVNPEMYSEELEESESLKSKK